MAELSGFEVLGLLNEIEANLRGAYINNIYKMGSSQLLRLRRPESEDLWLVVSPKKGVWLSRGVKERGETTEFTTRLRQELERARFLGASQADLDRVFKLEFEGREKRTLIVELMPPGNVIVTDPDGRILLASVEVRTPSRRVARGSLYSPPAQTRISPSEVNGDAIAAMALGEKTAGSAIGRHVALPKKYVSECLARLGLKDDSPSSSLGGRESEVLGALADMTEEARNPRPCICETPKGDEIYAFPPRGMTAKESGATLSELCDRLFLREAEAEPAAETPDEVRRKEMAVTISRLKAESAGLRVEASKVRGEAARARSSPLPEALSILRGSGPKQAREPSSSDSVASLLFDRAKELEGKAAAAMESAERLEKKAPKRSETARPRLKQLSRRRQEWYEKFRWFLTTGGKLAVGGRDAQTNAALLGKHTGGDDTIYHADVFGSPFFVLKKGAGQSESEVREVATATAAFSSAWKTGLGSADAYWVTPDQVSAAAPSGEYLSRGSFSIRGRKNFVNRNIVEVAVGVDGSGRVMAGPEDAIRSHCRPYVVLRPHNEKGSDTAKKVLRDLASMMADPAAAPPLDEVLRALPTGGGKVIRRGTTSQAGA